MKRETGKSELSRISIVDDDESIREAIKGLPKSVGLGAGVFASAEEFLNSGCLRDTACLILAVRMPGVGGLELQHQLVSDDCRIPIIFITAHASDEGARARAFQSGAVDFMYKPFDEGALLNDVYTAPGSGGGSALRPS